MDSRDTLEHMKGLAVSLSREDTIRLIHHLVDQLQEANSAAFGTEAPSAEDAGRIWNQCLEFIRAAIPRPTYDTWFSRTRGVAIDESSLELSAPNRFFVDWLQEHHMPVIMDTVSRVVGRSVDIRFTCRAKAA